MPLQNDVDMEAKLEKKDYVDLWKYFEDKATSIKGAMFNTITWIIGFAGALLGFIFAKLSDFDLSKASISLPMLMICISVAGLLICLFAFFALGESAKHITNNWAYADNCSKKLKELSEIVTWNEEGKRYKVMTIWNQLRIVVLLFLLAFIVILGIGASYPALGPGTKSARKTLSHQPNSTDPLTMN
jgi:hypothetical protein